MENYCMIGIRLLIYVYTCVLANIEFVKIRGNAGKAYNVQVKCRCFFQKTRYFWKSIEKNYI